MAFKFEKLEIWQLSKELSISVYQLNKTFPIDQATFSTLYSDSEKLSAKILAMKNAIKKRSTSNFVSEEAENYGI